MIVEWSQPTATALLKAVEQLEDRYQLLSRWQAGMGRRSKEGKGVTPVGVDEIEPHAGVGQTDSQTAQDSGLEFGGVFVDVSLAVTGFNAFVYGAKPGEIGLNT